MTATVKKNSNKKKSKSWSIIINYLRTKISSQINFFQIQSQYKNIALKKTPKKLQLNDKVIHFPAYL